MHDLWWKTHDIIAVIIFQRMHNWFVQKQYHVDVVECVCFFFVPILGSTVCFFIMFFKMIFFYEQSLTKLRILRKASNRHYHLNCMRWLQLWKTLQKVSLTSLKNHSTTTAPAASRDGGGGDDGGFRRSQSERWRTNPSFRLATSQRPVVVRKDVLTENPEAARSQRRRLSDVTTFSQTSVWRLGNELLYECVSRTKSCHWPLATGAYDGMLWVCMTEFHLYECLDVTDASDWMPLTRLTGCHWCVWLDVTDMNVWMSLTRLTECHWCALLNVTGRHDWMSLQCMTGCH